MNENSIGNTQEPKKAVKLSQVFMVVVSDTGKITIDGQTISNSEFIHLMAMLTNVLGKYNPEMYNVGALAIYEVNAWSENMVKLSNSEKP